MQPNERIESMKMCGNCVNFRETSKTCRLTEGIRLQNQICNVERHGQLVYRSLTVMK